MRSAPFVLAAALSTGIFSGFPSSLGHGAAEAPVYRIGIYQNAPKISLGDDGRARGFFPDLIDYLAGHAGFGFRYVPCQWAECLAMLESGGIDIMPDVAWSESRAKRFRFGRETVLSGWSYVYLHPGVNVQKLADFDRLKVAVLNDSIQHRKLKEQAQAQHIAVDILPTGSHDETLRAVETGAADAGIVNKPFGTVEEAKFNIRRSPLAFAPSSLFFAFHLDFPGPVVDAMDGALAILKEKPNSLYYRSKARWLEPAARLTVPDWLWWAAAAMVLALVASVIGIAYFRHRVEQATRELRTSERLLASVFDNIPIGIVIKGPDRKIERANRTYLDWFDLDDDDLAGRRAEDIEVLQSNTDWDVMNAHERAVLETGKPSARQVVRRFADGTFHTISIFKFPIYDQDGQIVKLGSVSVDLTDQLETQEALKQSESRFREFAEVTSDWFWEMDENLRFTYFSRRNQEVMGFDPSAYIGLTRREISADLDNDEKWRRHYADLENRLPFQDFRYSLKTVTGGRLNISISGNPVFDEAGRFRGYRGVGREFTPQMNAEIALRKSEEKYRAIFETSGVGMAICEMDGTLVECNQSYADIIGYDLHEVYDLTYWDITPRDYEADEARQLELLRTTGRFGPYEKYYIRKDGSRVPVLLNGSLIKGDAETDQIWSVVLDISARRRAEIMAQNALAEAERANQAKSEFLATMSHEFRTPLNAILGFSEMLRAQYFGPVGSQNYLEYANDIHDSGQHMLALVNDVLDIAAIEAGKRELHKELFAVQDVMQDCFRRFQKAASDGGIELAVKVPEDLEALYADKRSIMQIAQNLVSNAVKFTKPKGNVTLAATENGAGLEITVSDTGIGIAPENLSSITKPFAQSHADPHVYEEGTGLGLAIVKALVEAHEGELEIESRIGEGTTVRAKIPRTAPPTRPARGGVH